MKQYDILLEQLKNNISEGRLSKTLGIAALAGALGVGGSMLGSRQSDKLGSNKSEQIAAQKSTESNITEAGKQFIKSYEGLRTKPYDDQTGKTITAWNKHATIGYGHLISQDEWETYKNGITKEQANVLFDTDVTRFIQTVKNTIKTKLEPYQMDALVSLAVNIGPSRFKGSSIVKLINGEPGSDYTNKKDAWLAWNLSNGKISQGLINRRNAEWKMFSPQEG